MDSEALMLSGLQHFLFCRRQWALIHLEQQWAENEHTADGAIFHTRTHDEKQTELRSDVLTVRGLRVQSRRMHVTGVCDVVEFHRDAHGVPLSGREGLWRVYPVEYKKGAPKSHQADEAQLCAQAMCLEEMLLCEIPEGSLYYGETRRRTRVTFTPELRALVEASFEEMHTLLDRGYTPQVRAHRGCSACSLRELCLPRTQGTANVGEYLRAHLREKEDLL